MAKQIAVDARCQPRLNERAAAADGHHAAAMTGLWYSRREMWSGEAKWHGGDVLSGLSAK